MKALYSGLCHEDSKTKEFETRTLLLILPYGLPPCPALPCPALPCPALPRPALPRLVVRSVSYLVPIYRMSCQCRMIGIRKKHLVLLHDNVCVQSIQT
jgi:hypothetical protein